MSLIREAIYSFLLFAEGIFLKGEITSLDLKTKYFKFKRKEKENFSKFFSVE